MKAVLYGIGLIVCAFSTIVRILLCYFLGGSNPVSFPFFKYSYYNVILTDGLIAIVMVALLISFVVDKQYVMLSSLVILAAIPFGLYVKTFPYDQLQIQMNYEVNREKLADSVSESNLDPLNSLIDENSLDLLEQQHKDRIRKIVSEGQFSQEQIHELMIRILNWRVQENAWDSIGSRVDDLNVELYFMLKERLMGPALKLNLCQMQAEKVFGIRAANPNNWKDLIEDEDPLHFNAGNVIAWTYEKDLKSFEEALAKYPQGEGVSKTLGSLPFHILCSVKSYRRSRPSENGNPLISNERVRSIFDILKSYHFKFTAEELADIEVKNFLKDLK